MFRFEEDAFLRKGGDYSRNCLSFEEEEELAARLADRIPSISIPASVPTARTVFISAGGKCTEPLVRSFAKEPSSWSSNSVGQYGTCISSIVQKCYSQKLTTKVTKYQLLWMVN